MQCEELSEGLTIREFARLNKISEVTARRHVNSGKIPSYMVGGSRRIRVDDAAALQQTKQTDDLDEGP
jgi:excisionase family DNA binding protein